MKGKIKILTPVVRHELLITEASQAEVYQKSRHLKDYCRVDSDSQFIVYLELQSKMNEPDFMPED